MFDIYIRKPPDCPSNRELASIIINTFPEFEEYPRNIKEAAKLAKELAPDTGMSAEEYIGKNIGLELNYEEDNIWIQIHFWDEYISLSLPNFPQIEIDAMILKAMKYIDFFLDRNFMVEDYDEQEILKEDLIDKLIFLYQQRQSVVKKVAKIVKGTIPGQDEANNKK